MSKKIAFLGETCTDTFVYCDAVRLAPDVPVPILTEQYRIENDGMIGNVINNIRSLNDGVFDFDVFCNTDKPNKTRFVHSKTNHTFFRVDYNDSVVPFEASKSNVDKLLDYEFIVISDYNKGFLSEKVLEYLINRHDKVIIDTKKPIGNWCQHAYLIKINEYEYDRSVGMPIECLKNCIVTLGGRGAIYDGKLHKVEICQVKDSSGAGDTFFAGLIYSHCILNKSVEESVIFANKCASSVVKKKGVSVVDKKDIFDE